MIETGVVINKAGRPIHWHLPENRTSVSLPDSRDLWDVIWENRDNISGFAHSHPGSGWPYPSVEDATTFRAIEKALGRRLDWWVISEDKVILCVAAGHEYRIDRVEDKGLPWISGLRVLSYEKPAAAHEALLRLKDMEVNDGDGTDHG